MRFFVLIGFLLASSVGMTPGLMGFASAESKAPVEELELDREAVLCLRFHTHVRRHSCNLSSLISTPQHPCCNSSVNTILAPPAGHRLSNHLLAPLRC